MRKLTIVFVATWVATAAVLVDNGPAGAVIPDKVGWWGKYQQLPTKDVGVPPPPTIASDQLNVTGDGTPEGAIISAVRYVIPDGARAKLTLKAPEGQTVNLPPGVYINACVTTSGWDGGANLAWQGRPAYDCQQLAAGGAQTGTCNETLSSQGAIVCDTLVFDFGPEFQLTPGVIDVALVPGGTAIPFTASLVQPDDSALEVYAIPDDPGSAENLDPSFDPFLGDVAAVGDVPLDASAFAFDGGLAAPTAGSPGGPLRRAAAPLKPADTGPDRLLALAMLLLLSVGFLWVGGQPVRAPRLLGSLGDRQTS